MASLIRISTKRGLHINTYIYLLLLLLTIYIYKIYSLTRDFLTFYKKSLMVSSGGLQTNDP